MEITTIASVLQSSLSVVGFLALSFWMMKWAKGLNDRNKELGEIDKEIRATLKESLIAKTELHEIERKKLEVELTNLIRKVEKSAGNLHTAKEIGHAAINTIDVLCRIASHSQRVSIERESNGNRENYYRIVEILISRKIISKQMFEMELEANHNNRKTFSSNEEELLWRLKDMYIEPTRVASHATTMVHIAPIAIDYFLKNPSTSEEEIQKFISGFIKDEVDKLKAELIRLDNKTKGPGSK
jgi:hypothetical protein